jgi:hypothetical protein
VTAFADDGPGGTGELLAIMIKLGKAGSNAADDHSEVTKLAPPRCPADSSGRGWSAPAAHP